MSNANRSGQCTKPCPKCKTLLYPDTMKCVACGYQFSEEDAKKVPTRKGSASVSSTARVKQVSETNEPRSDFSYEEEKEKIKDDFMNGRINEAELEDACYQLEMRRYDQKNRLKQEKKAQKTQKQSFPIAVYIGLLCLIVSMVGGYFWLMAWLFEVIKDSNVFLLIALFSLCMIIGAPVGLGRDFSGKMYGMRSPGGYYFFCFLVVAATIIADVVFFVKVVPTAAAGDILYLMAIAASVSVFIVLIQYNRALQKEYCVRCDRTNAFRFSRVVGREETYGYEFEDIPEHQVTATTNFRGNGYATNISATTRYTVPASQRNLGLHKYILKDNEYVCTKCGAKQIRKSRDVNKI